MKVYGLREIGESACKYCTSLTFIKLPSIVTEVGSGAFDRCINLKKVTLNKGLQEIWDHAFCDCTSLTIIKLPSTVIVVGDNAFYGCTDLKEVILMRSLKRLGVVHFLNVHH